MFDLVMLFGTILLWHFCDQGRYIPVELKTRTVIGPNGQDRKETYEKFLLAECLWRKEGFLLLVVGNLMGIMAIVAFVIFLIAAKPLSSAA